MTAKRRAAFLDRDGVINIDTGYVHKTADFTFVPGAVEAMRRLQEHGYELVIVTNQSGIGRRYFSEEAFSKLTDWMTAELARKSVTVLRTYHCPHKPVASPSSSCDCRKPRPGMILRAVQELDLDLGRSILVGDKPTDIVAGVSAGVGRNYQVGLTSAMHPNASGEFADLASFAEWFIEHDGVASPLLPNK